jgi:predicted enzyme related to lactoylglutathione lyase
MKKSIRNNLIIELHVPDLEVVKDFYSKIGFEITMDDIPNEKDPGYLTMTRKDGLGSTILNFYGGDERVYNQSYFKQFSRETKRGYATEITICVSDIEEIYEKVCSGMKECVVRELKELEDHGHKWRDFRLEDPFGFYIRFTELIDWGQN